MKIGNTNQEGVEQMKFEYSPLGKIFNEGLEVYNKKNAILNRLNDNEGKKWRIIKSN